MTIAETFLPQFEHEMQGCRRMLERVPVDKFAYRPHPKSMTLGQLAAHLAEIPGYTVPTIEQSDLDVAPKGGSAYVPPKAESAAQLLEVFDRNVAAARVLISKTTDEQMHAPWSLLKSGEAMFTLPRIAVLRGFVLSHLIHHRAQLGLYLRMNDIPVPSIYGPSADEG